MSLRWRRFLPDRSQLWIPLAVLILVVAGAGFMNLASSRSLALAENRAVAAQVVQLEEQQERLNGALATSLDSGNGEVKGREYFGLSQPNETRVVAEPFVVAPEPLQAPAETQDGPYWLEWWKRLVNP